MASASTTNSQLVVLADAPTARGKGLGAQDCVIARCPRYGLRANLITMTEWTQEAIKAEVEYRRRNAECNWQRSNGRAPSWISRVIHGTSKKPGGTKA